MPPDLFGICVVGTDGDVFAAGDADVEFTIMSVAKPFVFALVCEALGPDEARAAARRQRDRPAVQLVAAVEQSADGRTNPMVNPGAIATTSLVPGRGRRALAVVHEGLSRFAGRALALDEEVYALGRRRRTTATAASRGCSSATAGSAATRPRRSTSTRGRARSPSPRTTSP